MPVKIAKVKDLPSKKPVRAKVLHTDLVIVRDGDDVAVLYGRCPHRGALLSDGCVKGKNIICGLHNWDFRYDTGISDYNPKEKIHKFTSVIHAGFVYIDQEEVEKFEIDHSSPFSPDAYLGDYKDTHPEPTEPYTNVIKDLAINGLKNVGHHGKMVAMGVERITLPSWDDIQILPVQVATKPLFDEDDVTTKTIIGPQAKKPLTLEIPLFVSDMSYGALSREAKIALATGAQKAGTGICSGEGGMLPAEQEANTRYFYQLASGQFGFSWDKMTKIQAFHFKGGQGAKVGTGGHLPGAKVTKEIAEVRGLKPGEDAISPATYRDITTIADFKKIAAKVRKLSGGIPIGFKLAASHIEDDIDFALSIGVDYIILDGRGGGTGATPEILRDNICVPTIPAIARARKHLDQKNANDVTLIATGGLRTASDFVKALALGADAIALSNAALQAIGCTGMRACNTNNCPVGIATQRKELRARLDIGKSAGQLAQYFDATTDLMKVLVRACGHNNLAQLNKNDLATFNYDVHRLSGVSYAGVEK